jgi:hypothetical protein
MNGRTELRKKRRPIMTAPLDPATRFSLAQIERAFRVYLVDSLGLDWSQEAANFHWAAIQDDLAAQRGVYPGSRAGSGGYPSGRPRQRKNESPADYYARLETWKLARKEE